MIFHEAIRLATFLPRETVIRCCERSRRVVETPYRIEVARQSHGIAMWTQNPVAREGRRGSTPLFGTRSQSSPPLQTRRVCHVFATPLPGGAFYTYLSLEVATRAKGVAVSHPSRVRVTDAMAWLGTLPRPDRRTADTLPSPARRSGPRPDPDAVKAEKASLARYLGEYLSTLRHQRGITQAALASRIGVSRSLLAMVEGGRKVAPVWLLRRCAPVLGFQARIGCDGTNPGDTAILQV